MVPRTEDHHLGIHKSTLQAWSHYDGPEIMSSCLKSWVHVFFVGGWLMSTEFFFCPLNWVSCTTQTEIVQDMVPLLIAVNGELVL